MKRIHLFKTGTHTAMNGQTISFGESDLAASAAAYDPTLHESPLVIGHPKTDAPAYGWVKSVEFEDGELVAIPHQVNAEFAELVASHAYKKISASFYQPDQPGNPVPGKYYLRHVGFLGAQPPAVKGLRPIEFADDDSDFVTIEFGEIEPRTIARMFRGIRDLLIEKFGQADADKALPGWDTDWIAEQAVTPAPNEKSTTPAFSEVPDPSPASATPKETKVDDEEIKKRLEALAKAEAAFAEKQAQRGAIDFADTLIKDGKLAPANKDQVVSLVTHLAMHNSDATISFGEAPAASPVDMLKSILAAAPKIVDFSEQSAASDDAPIDFSDPTVLADAARGLVAEQAEKGIVMTHAQAVRKLQKGA
ncbi:peptidase [Thalassospira marina]|uniref:Peptidase n=1 Tax=Thalassospira marina TaxID=2048283 RepID=A0A2N3KY33_9PROT|nr:peptidase [Thalassospira marina]PKR55484.1 peptidase [Thalassospira marina]